MKRNIRSGIPIKNHELKAITQTINGNILRSLLPLRKPTPKRRPILVRSHTGDFGGLKSFDPVWIQEWHFGHQTTREDGNHIPCFLPSALDHTFQFTQGIWPGGDPQYPGQFPNHDFCPGFQKNSFLSLKKQRKPAKTRAFRAEKTGFEPPESRRIRDRFNHKTPRLRVT